jgi:hypothetical protein
MRDIWCRIIATMIFVIAGSWLIGFGCGSVAIGCGVFCLAWAMCIKP